ncbi:MAG TPA: c-type cytochrome domain-containing protein, partial [Opitutus sp.]|nr:c-type cytochrome domain-containing protein [Opitutus sp.]
MSHRNAAPFGAKWKQCLVVAAVALTTAGAAGAEGANGEPTFYEARVAPIFEQHCVSCHGPDKAKAKLRLDTFEQLKRGSENGEIVLDGNIEDSELFYRIGLPETHEDVMPSDGKPLLSATEIKVIELWIKAGASPVAAVSAFPDAPAPKRKPGPVVPLTEDWRPLVGQIRALEKELGVKLAPRSLVPTDGLVLRTASAPLRCDDAVLARLEPVAAYIVEAELARTKVTDAGLAAIARWENLRSLDLTRTAVTSRGVGELVSLKKLERLNLTSTGVDDAGLQVLREIPSLQ